MGQRNRTVTGDCREREKVSRKDTDGNVAREEDEKGAKPVRR